MFRLASFFHFALLSAVLAAWFLLCQAAEKSGYEERCKSHMREALIYFAFVSAAPSVGTCRRSFPFCFFFLLLPMEPGGLAGQGRRMGGGVGGETGPVEAKETTTMRAQLAPLSGICEIPARREEKEGVCVYVRERVYACRARGTQTSSWMGGALARQERGCLLWASLVAEALTEWSRRDAPRRRKRCGSDACVLVCVCVCACASACVCMPVRAWVQNVYVGVFFFFFAAAEPPSVPLPLPPTRTADMHVESGIRSWGVSPLLSHWAWLPCLERQGDITGLLACASQMTHHGDSRTLACLGGLPWQTRKKKNRLVLRLLRPCCLSAVCPPLFGSDMGGQTRQAPKPRSSLRRPWKKQFRGDCCYFWGLGETGGLLGPCPVMKGWTTSTTEEVSVRVRTPMESPTGTLGRRGNEFVVVMGLADMTTLDDSHPSVFVIECDAKRSRDGLDMVTRFGSVVLLPSP